MFISLLSALVLVLVDAGFFPNSIMRDCFLIAFFFSFLLSSLCILPLAAAREVKIFSANEIGNVLFQVLSGLAFVHKHGKRLLLYFTFSFQDLTG